MKGKSNFRRISDNPVTGNPRIQGAGRLISINMTPFPLNNDNKTMAHVATVELINDAGEVTTKTGICYATNLEKYGHVPFGTEVLVTQEQTPGYDTLLTTVAPHLAAGTRASAEEFAAAFDQAPAKPTPSEIRNAQRAGKPITANVGEES